jgi:hypothetical protein
LAKFVIARPGTFASEFGFLSVVSALIHQVPQVRTLNAAAPRSLCDFILASNAPVATHVRRRIFHFEHSKQPTFLKRKES